MPAAGGSLRVLCAERRHSQPKLAPARSPAVCYVEFLLHCSHIYLRLDLTNFGTHCHPSVFMLLWPRLGRDLCWIVPRCLESRVTVLSSRYVHCWHKKQERFVFALKLRTKNIRLPASFLSISQGQVSPRFFAMSLVAFE